jgi:hypothetical protein
MEGSVMFCVDTAPTSLRVKAQRAATAGEEEVTATPNIPVSSQRATIENVILKLWGPSVSLRTKSSFSNRLSL